MHEGTFTLTLPRGPVKRVEPGQLLPTFTFETVERAPRKRSDQDFNYKEDIPHWRNMKTFYPVDEKVKDIIEGRTPMYFTVKRSLTEPYYLEGSYRWAEDMFMDLRDNCSFELYEDLAFRFNRCIPGYIVDLAEAQLELLKGEPLNEYTVAIANDRIRAVMHLHSFVNHEKPSFKHCINHVLGIEPFYTTIQTVKGKVFRAED